MTLRSHSVHSPTYTLQQIVVAVLVFGILIEVLSKTLMVYLFCSRELLEKQWKLKADGKINLYELDVHFLNSK